MKHEDSHEWIQPLKRSANDFLQVLVPSYEISRNQDGEGFTLTLEFDPDSQSIWHRRGKDQVQSGLIRDFKTRRSKYKARLEEFFFGNDPQQTFRFHDPAFPFRFCSGGALPIISIGDKRYYRLHWRDIHPVGWNIANGGSDSIAEMLNPVRIIQREVSEELVVFDLNPERPRRMVLGDAICGEGFPSDAWRRWQERMVFQEQDHPSLRNERLAAGWLEGPDSLSVEYHPENLQGRPRHCGGLFLNINADDFGIEFDRILRIDLPESAVICDGELLSGHLLNSPVGLFEVDALSAKLLEGQTRFDEPSMVFWGGARHDPSRLGRIVDWFLAEKAQNGLLPPVEREQLKDAREAGREFDLCPVSRNLIRRFADLNASGNRHRDLSPIDVFISFASEDEKDARRVFDRLEAKGRKPVFFSSESIRSADFCDEIFSALGRSRNLVAFGTRVDRLLKNWVHYECKSFFNKKMREQAGGREMITFFCDVPENTLPPEPLETYETIHATSATLDRDIEKLIKKLAPVCS